MKEIPALFFFFFLTFLHFLTIWKFQVYYACPSSKYISICKACRYILWSNKLIIFMLIQSNCGNKIIQPCFSYDTVGFSYDTIRLHQKRYIEDENLPFSLNITMTFWSKHANCVFSWVFWPKVLGGGGCTLYTTAYYIRQITIFICSWWEFMQYGWCLTYLC